MANAGLIEGTYSGITGPGGSKHSVIGVNVPNSRMAKAGWTLFYMGPRDAAHASWFEDDYGHAYFFGTQHVQFESATAALRPEELWNIDTKLDDGKPTYGFIMERKRLGAAPPDGGTYQCTTSAIKTTAEYDVQNSSIACMMLVKSRL